MGFTGMVAWARQSQESDPAGIGSAEQLEDRSKDARGLPLADWAEIVLEAMKQNWQSSNLANSKT